MALLGSRPSDDTLLALFEEAGANAQRTCLLLRDLLRDVPEERPVTPLGFVPRGFGNTASGSGSGGLASPLPSLQMPATPTSAVQTAVEARIGTNHATHSRAIASAR